MALAAVLLAGHARAAYAQDASALASELSALVTASPFAATTSVSVTNAANDRVLFEHQPTLALNPASNAKLLTAAAALARLGTNYRFRTELFGSVTAARIPVLTVRGGGDPTLVGSDLVGLAHELRHVHAVVRIDRVVLDPSRYEAAPLPPAYDQQPNEDAAFRAPIGALSVDGNAIGFSVYGGTNPSFRVRPSEYARVDFAVTTGRGDVRVNASVDGATQSDYVITARGTIPVASEAHMRFRVVDPNDFFGFQLLGALRSVGIVVPAACEMGAAPEGTGPLTSRYSAPLATIVQRLGKQSDNFVAEMLLRELAAHARGTSSRGATSDAGARVLSDYASELRLPRDGLVVRNGSGLFDANRMTSAFLVRLLGRMSRDPVVGPEYLAHLSIAGVDGTLADRFRDVGSGVSIRAKTGTLDDAIALSGYLDRQSERIAFSVVMNGVSRRHDAAINVADSIVRTLIRSRETRRAVPRPLPSR